MDHNIEKAERDVAQQLLTLKNLKDTGKKLQGRNDKLHRTASQGFANPIPLLNSNVNAVDSIPVNALQTGDSSPCEQKTDNMKPKARGSFDSSMDTDATPGLANDYKLTESDSTYSMFLLDIIEMQFNLTPNFISHFAGNTSDPFFDADATVLGSDVKDTDDSSGAGDTDGNNSNYNGNSNGNNPQGSAATCDATEADTGEQAVPGEDIATMLNLLGAPKPIPEAVKKDLDGISAAVIKAGGLVSNKPQENRERKGQVLELENLDLDLGELSERRHYTHSLKITGTLGQNACTNKHNSWFYSHSSAANRLYKPGGDKPRLLNKTGRNREPIQLFKLIKLCVKKVAVNYLNYPRVVISTRAVISVITLIIKTQFPVKISRPFTQNESRGCVATDLTLLKKIIKVATTENDRGSCRVINYVIMVISTHPVFAVITPMPATALNKKATEIKTITMFSLLLITGELGPLSERPDEGTLQRSDYKDLLPPPSNVEVPEEFQLDATLPEYVKEERIEFLLVQKPLNSDAAWSFPSEENLHKIWTHVRNQLDSDYILDVCL